MIVWIRRISLAGLGAVLLAAMPVAAADKQSLSPDQRKSIEQIVREYILEHPEIITEAIQILQKRERVEAARTQAAAMAAQREEIYDHPMTPISGDPKGDVTIVEFFDYRCGFCKRSLSAMMSLMRDDPKLKFVWKEFPILGPVSRYAARAAMAARKQDKYLEFHVAVMGARGQLTEARVLKLAAGVGVDVERLQKEMADPAIAKYLDETIQLAQALGIRGTPAFIIGGKIFPGAVGEATMKDYVATLRSSSPKPTN
jgi:protein-disulfide isomerase